MQKNQGSSNETIMQFAQALFDVAREEKATQETLAAAKRMADCQLENYDLQRLAANPKFELKSIENVIEELNKKMKLGKIVHNCLKILAQSRRLALFPKIAARLQELEAQQRGEVKGKVVSANKLNATEKKSLEAAFKSRLGKAPLALHFDEDKSLISGIVVTIQSRMIDLSLRSELRRLKQKLYNTEQAI